jgi:hypothetical protein
MESISNIALSQFAPERSPRNAGHESEQGERTRNQQVDNARSNGMQLDIRQRHEVGNRHGHGHGHGEESSTMAFRRSDRTTLTIETREGDVVRLKIRASKSPPADIEQLEEDGTTMSEFGLQARSRMRISVKIDGNLNAEEHAAIQAVIEQASAMASDFFVGNVEGAFA